MNERVQKGNVDLIFVGDSITHGWENSSGKPVWDRYYVPRNAVNLGISGDQTCNVLWRLENGNIDGISPKLAVVMIGTNNAGQRPFQSSTQIAAGVEAIVEKLRTKLPTTKILLLAIFPRGDNDEYRKQNEGANAIISKLTDGKQIFFLDINSKFLAPDGKLTKEMFPDLLHPGQKAYEIWAEAMEPIIQKVVGGSPTTAIAQKTNINVASNDIATKPVPRGGKWMERHESMNARVQKGNVDLLFIGDSITHGWENYYGKPVWDRYYGRRNAVNLGIGGDQTSQVLWRLENGNIDGISPKLAVVMIGTNNAGAGQSPEQIAAGVKAIVETLRKKLPKTKILLLAIFPRGADANDGLRKRNEGANAIISKLADRKKVFFLDINSKFLSPDGKLSKDIMPDLLHPITKGYIIWADAIEPSVKKLMGE